MFVKVCLDTGWKPQPPCCSIVTINAVRLDAGSHKRDRRVASGCWVFTQKPGCSLLANLLMLFVGCFLGHSRHHHPGHLANPQKLGIDPVHSGRDGAQ
jgi:hypothetical protein